MSEHEQDEVSAPSPDEEILIGTADAATVLGIAPRTVRKRIDQGLLRATKINNTWMIYVRRSEVEAAGIPIPDSDDDGAVPGAAEGVGEALIAGSAARAASGSRSVPAAVDLQPLASMIERLDQEKTELAAAAAMWQERARQAEHQLQQSQLALEAGGTRMSEDEVSRRIEAAVAQAKAEARADFLEQQQARRSWWAKLFGG